VGSRISGFVDQKHALSRDRQKQRLVEGSKEVETHQRLLRAGLKMDQGFSSFRIENDPRGGKGDDATTPVGTFHFDGDVSS